MKGMAVGPRSPFTLVRPSRTARRLLLHLFSIGRTAFDKPTPMTPFKVPGAVVLWVVAGHGRMRFDDDEWEMKAGPEFWFYGTERRRVFLPVPGTAIVVQAFWFGGPGLEGWLEELDAKRHPQFQVRFPRTICQAYQTMRRLVRQRPPDWQWKVHLQLGLVLGELLRARNLFHIDETAPAVILEVLNKIEADRARDWKVRELAALAGMSYSSFAELFARAMHEPPHTYLQRMRLDFAREMLGDPELRVKEIARRLHFSSEYYFSNFFRKHAGASPTKFRQRLGSPPAKD